MSLTVIGPERADAAQHQVVDRGRGSVGQLLAEPGLHRPELGRARPRPTRRAAWAGRSAGGTSRCRRARRDRRPGTARRAAGPGPCARRRRRRSARGRRPGPRPGRRCRSAWTTGCHASRPRPPAGRPAARPARRARVTRWMVIRIRDARTTSAAPHQVGQLLGLEPASRVHSPTYGARAPGPASRPAARWPRRASGRRRSSSSCRARVARFRARRDSTGATTTTR